MIQKKTNRAKTEEGVSEVIGELMMLLLTVTIFIILIAAVGSLISKPRSEIVHMDALALNGTTLEIQHRGGDPVAYGNLAVIVNGHLLPALVTDANSNGLWDLGEGLYLYGVDTHQSLSILVYDNSARTALGDFTLNPLPSGTPTPAPTTTPTPTNTATPTPTPQVTINGGTGWVENVASVPDNVKGNGWNTYTLDVVLQVNNQGSTPAYNVQATCTPPSVDDTKGIDSVTLLSSPATNPATIDASGNVKFRWHYQILIQQTKSATFALTAKGANTNQISTGATFTNG